MSSEEATRVGDNREFRAARPCVRRFARYRRRDRPATASWGTQVSVNYAYSDLSLPLQTVRIGEAHSPSERHDMPW